MKPYSVVMVSNVRFNDTPQMFHVNATDPDAAIELCRRELTSGGFFATEFHAVIILDGFVTPVFPITDAWVVGEMFPTMLSQSLKCSK